MLWRDFREYGDCEECPLKKHEMCIGAMACYGGTPIEPPCVYFDETTDLDEVVRNHFKAKKMREQREDVLAAKDKRRKVQAQKAAATRRELNNYCKAEISEIRRINKAIKMRKEQQSVYEAKHTINKMFNCDANNVLMNQLVEELRQLEIALDVAKQRYAEKRNEFYEVRKRNIGK